MKNVVRRHYAELATLSKGCCASETGLAREDSLVPEESIRSAASCGSPLTHAVVHEGDIILDLGSGAGIDVFRASKLVGASGKVIGVDSTPEMIFKARELAKKYDYKNVEFRLGEIENIPLESNSVDLAISNCVINLVPDKASALREIYRALKPGGRIAISDMIATCKTPNKGAVDLQEWAACIAGAITIDEYKELLENTGFREIEYLDESSGAGEACCSSILPVKSVTWLATKP